MSTQSFLELPQTANPRDVWERTAWLPSVQQVQQVLQAVIQRPIGAWHEAAQVPPALLATSMRQAIGLIMSSALLGGALPFLVNWVVASQMGTALPLAHLAQWAETQSNAPTQSPAFTQAWTETARLIAGLEPRLPGWLAAGLSALGTWINWPLNWLTLWLVYGLGVAAVAKALGATNTLQHFYAATGYAFVPLILLGLTPIPYLGSLATLVALIGALVVYLYTVTAVTSLPVKWVLLSVIGPVVAVVVLGFLLMSLLFLLLLPLLV